MKKFLFLLLSAPFFLFSCKKEHSAITPLNTGKKYPVVFNVSNFASHSGLYSSKNITNSIKHSNSLADSVVNVGDYLDVLYYYVFNSDGYVVSRLKQDSASASFGRITDSLKAGHYTIIMAAGKKGLVPTVSTFPVSFINYSGFNWQDTFFVKLQLNVANGGTNQDVTLQRIVGKLELQLLDAIPSNAYCITLKIYPEYDRYNFNQPGSGFFRTDTIHTDYILPLSAIGSSGFTLDKIIGNTFVNCKVVIICRDAANNIIAQATANTVSISANTKTILSGNLFTSGGGPNAQTFQVKIDTAWASTTNTVHF